MSVKLDLEPNTYRNYAGGALSDSPFIQKIKKFVASDLFRKLVAQFGEMAYRIALPLILEKLKGSGVQMTDSIIRDKFADSYTRQFVGAFGKLDKSKQKKEIEDEIGKIKKEHKLGRARIAARAYRIAKRMKKTPQEALMAMLTTEPAIRVISELDPKQKVLYEKILEQKPTPTQESKELKDIVARLSTQEEVSKKTIEALSQAIEPYTKMTPYVEEIIDESRRFDPEEKQTLTEIPVLHQFVKSALDDIDEGADEIPDFPQTIVEQVFVSTGRERGEEILRDIHETLRDRISEQKEHLSAFPEFGKILDEIREIRNIPRKERTKEQKKRLLELKEQTRLKGRQTIQATERRGRSRLEGFEETEKKDLERFQEELQKAIAEAKSKKGHGILMPDKYLFRHIPDKHIKSFIFEKKKGGLAPLVLAIAPAIAGLLGSLGGLFLKRPVEQLSKKVFKGEGVGYDKSLLPLMKFGPPPVSGLIRVLIGHLLKQKLTKPKGEGIPPKAEVPDELNMPEQLPKGMQSAEMEKEKKGLEDYLEERKIIDRASILKDSSIPKALQIRILSAQVKGEKEETDKITPDVKLTLGVDQLRHPLTSNPAPIQSDSMMSYFNRLYGKPWTGLQVLGRTDKEPSNMPAEVPINKNVTLAIQEKESGGAMMMPGSGGAMMMPGSGGAMRFPGGRTMELISSKTPKKSFFSTTESGGAMNIVSRRTVNRSIPTNIITLIGRR